MSQNQSSGQKNPPQHQDQQPGPTWTPLIPVDSSYIAGQVIHPNDGEVVNT